MSSLQQTTASCLLFLLVTTTPGQAQFGGSRAGAQQHAAPSQPVQPTALPVDEVESYIQVDGVAEVRIVPTEIRVVLAVVTEGATASACQDSADQLVASLKSDWQTIGIPSEEMFEDFISILPIYRYEEQEQNKLTVLQEVLDKYRYQTNLHLKVKDDELARRAINAAFARNITDIVAFDYWHPELDAAKTQAMKRAVEAARRKSDVLLAGSLFEERPKLINIREQTQTLFPVDLYHTFQNAVHQSVTLPYRQNIPRISAPRAQTTYYRGAVIEGDATSPELPMKPAISVVSRVRLYFDSPFEHDDDEDD